MRKGESESRFAMKLTLHKGDFGCMLDISHFFGDLPNAYSNHPAEICPFIERADPFGALADDQWL